MKRGTKEWHDLKGVAGKAIPECGCGVPSTSHTTLLHWWETGSPRNLTERGTVGPTVQEPRIERSVTR